MKKDKVLGLILSGSGSDATAILNAWLDDKMPCGIRVGVIIVTNKNAGFFAREKDFPGGVFPVPVVVLNRADYKIGGAKNIHNIQPMYIYSKEVRSVLDEHGVDFTFYVGNIAMIDPMGNWVYNIHPAKKEPHGGSEMYGLAVHKHVLEKICDEIWRGRKGINYEHYTTVTVHEVDRDYDSGQNLIELEVQIPLEITEAYYELFIKLKKAHDYLEKNGGTVDKAVEISVILKGMTEIAGKLQKHVLEFEWSILPKAVEIAARKLNTIQ